MKITIYTITDCQFSKQEKEYLTSHSLPFEEKNLETNHEYLTEMLNVSNNFAGTPVTKLEKDDGNIVVLKGFTVEEFDKELGLKTEPKAAEATSEKKPEAQASAKVEISVDTKNAAPQPPNPTTPQPPPPVPQPPLPQPPTPNPAPEPPTPSIPNQFDAPTNTQPQNNAMAQSPINVEPDAPAIPVENTVDDASLDAILNQLQQKTAEQSAPTTPPGPGNNAPTVPDFGSNN